MTVASLVWLLSSTVAVAPSSGAADRLVPIASFEASESDDAAGAWSAIAVDGGAGAKAWRRARSHFELPGPVEAGEWLLAVGGPELELDVTLNGRALERASDAYASDLRTKTGARFLVPSVALHAGANDLEVAFHGVRRGRGFERGPAWLASPSSAQPARAATESNDLVLSIANFATLASVAKSEVLLDRVLFKYGSEGDEPRLAAQVDCAIVDPAHGNEIELRELDGRRGNDLARFPTVALQLTDKRLRGFHGQLTACASFATAPLLLSDAKAVVFELSQNQNGQSESAEFVWHLRFFPTVGGPLRVVKNEGWTLLHNDVVGLLAQDAQLLGPPDAPAGLSVTLRNVASKTSPMSLAGPSALCGVVGFERTGADPSQAETLEELASALLDHHDEDLVARRALAESLASEPAEAKTPYGVASRNAILATLVAARRRGRRFLFRPDEGADSPAAFFGDTSSLLHFPVHERLAVEWLLSTESAEGAVRGELPPDASELDVATTDVFAVLRACRWFRWTYDGDHFAPLLPKVEKALAHADRLDVAAAAPKEGAARVGPLGFALARIAAHREWSAALEQVGSHADAAAASSQAALTQLDTLLAAPARGGRFAESGFVLGPGDDPRDGALALTFGLLDDARARTVATRLGELQAPLRELDWRDVLVVRALLESGWTKPLGRGWESLQERVATAESPWSAAYGGYHGALLFGALGLRRPDLGTIEVMPRLDGRQALRSTILLPEGPLRITVQPPDPNTKRQLVFTNQSTLDLMATFGVPFGASSSGKRVQIGDRVFLTYDELVQHGASWRALLPR